MLTWLIEKIAAAQLLYLYGNDKAIYLSLPSLVSVIQKDDRIRSRISGAVWFYGG